MSEAPAQPAKKKNRAKKWTMIVGAVVVLTAAAGAGAQFLVRPQADAEKTASARKIDPIFVSLEQFTVNLADEGGERFAQVGVTLEVLDERIDKAIRAHMPSIRNTVLLLLSSKQTDDLLTLDGKKQLAAQIAQQAGRQLGWAPQANDGQKTEAPNPIAAVHFSHFIVQ
ncbi:MAG: flagellar basal body-associated FliL family protein [Burkholderiaceae bacterium]|jgi:flagellar FliL protein|nr:flagellar basal body-associated FliL family protein [Burkholderiaceae bacterium]